MTIVNMLELSIKKPQDVFEDAKIAEKTPTGDILENKYEDTLHHWAGE